MNLSKFMRRTACEVRIGRTTIGGGHPVACQSMTNTDTNDTAASVAQIERIDRAGGKIVRLTAQGRREGENLENIVRQLAAQTDNVGILFPSIPKESLFETILIDGILPRKTFSMGTAADKRFYLECRKIKP